MNLTDQQKVVQAWEAFKADKNMEPGSREIIPESVLRSILSRQNGIGANNVTWEQVRQAGAALCLHYGSAVVIPLDSEAKDPPKAEPESIATSQFWREREDEFHHHDSPENCELWAEWSSITDEWVFHTGSGQKPPPLGSVQVFKALAREAAKGLVGPRSAEPANDWLDALRRKTDKSTGRRLYSKVATTGTNTIGENWLARMAKLGEPAPSRGMVEFVARKEGHTPADQPNAPEILSDIVTIEERMFWDVTTEKIEHLFTSSANFCLELRSLVAGVPERPTQPPAHHPILTVPESEIHVPELSATTERELMLRWENTLEERKLTGKHFHWHANLRDRTGHIVVRKNVDPLSQIGVRQSVVVAELRFNGLAGAYFDIWDRSYRPYQIFQDWLPAILGRVLRDAALAWRGRDAALDEWYERVCSRAINAELRKLAEKWTNKARNRELLKLEITKSRANFLPMSVSPPLQSTANASRLDSHSAIPKAPSETPSLLPAKVAAQGAAIQRAAPSDLGLVPVRGAICPEKPTEQEDFLAAGVDPICADRRDLLLRFKLRGKNIGIQITDEMVAHAANPKWNDRTMVTWWKRNDSRCKQPHDRKIRAVLASDPSSSWTPNVKSKRSLK